MEENNNAIIDERKERILKILNKKGIWVFGVLILALILGIYLRSQPMLDHGGTPGLWDITTHNWTLGPDLDPWLFTRIAGEIAETGSIPKMDMMRNVPLGFNNAEETVLLPYMIFWTYKIANFFGSYNINFAGALFPVIAFAFTILAFFFFVREAFIGPEQENKTKANIISLISTFLMIVIPVFLPRTVAGIPEKESAAFFFLFLGLFFFIKAWKQKTLASSIIWGALAGISTAGMGMISGLFSYLYAIIFAASFFAFILNKFEKNQIAMYTSWWFAAAFALEFLPSKVSIRDLLTSMTVAPAFFLLIIIYINLILWGTSISKKEWILKIKLPKTIVSVLISLGIVLVAVLILEPSLISDKYQAITQMLFHPVTGRWNTTVAENSQPHFTQWVGNFGPVLRNIPILFWLFFIGSVVLFKRMLHSIKNKDAWILTGLYLFFLSGMVFSRYSDTGILTGENFISKAFYGLSLLIFIAGVIRYYIIYYKEGERGFERIDYSYLILLSLLIIAIFSARGAVRLIMFLGPVAPIFAGYLVVEFWSYYKRSQNETKKIFAVSMFILILILSIFCFVNYYKVTKSQAYGFIPSHYNNQWQKAMDWVRKETPENAVFGHWWDYGYWLQSIGNRATVLDGGNAISFWNYWMGRLVLTGDNQQDALDFLYAHNTTHFLIDSSDLGKYGAFSQIGSDINYDRRSWIGNFLIDDKQTQETNNETVYVYTGGVALDEDLVIKKDGKEILLPQGKTAVAGIIFSTSQNGEKISQPKVVMIYNGMRYDFGIRYVSMSGKQFLDFKEQENTIDAGIYLLPYLENSNGKINNNPTGALMFLSPRLMRSMLIQKYLLNDPFNNYPNFKLVHNEENIIIQSWNSQGANLPEFIYYQGVQGPIKIWEIQYTGKEKIDEKYLERDSSKYLSWEL